MSKSFTNYVTKAHLAYLYPFKICMPIGRVWDHSMATVHFNIGTAASTSRYRRGMSASSGAGRSYQLAPAVFVRSWFMHMSTYGIT